MKKFFTLITAAFFTTMGAMAAQANESDAKEARASISEMSLSVAEGEQIDEDGDFKVTFNYKVTVTDEELFPACSFKVSVYDAENKAIVEGELWTFNYTASSRNFYISNLEGGKEYTVKIDEVVLKDNSKVDMETITEGEILVKITEGLPTLKFTPVAAEVKPVEIKAMSVTYDKNSTIDEEGDYSVTFNYTAKINDASIKAEDTFAKLMYDVYDENFAVVANGSRDFSLAESARNVYISNLTAGKSYTMVVTGIVVYGPDNSELLNITEGLPKLNFKVKDANAVQAITMSNMSFVVAEGEQFDEDGDFKFTFNYTATVNDPSAITFAYATIAYVVTDENGEKVDENLKDFSYEANAKGLYMSNLKAGKTYTVTATKIEIQDFASMEMLCEMDKDLPSLTFTVSAEAGSTGINAAKTANSVSKYMENGKIIVVKNGKKYGINAIEVK